MNTSDLVLHFVNKYIEEREKSFFLQQQLEKQQKQIDNKVKTN